LTHRIKFSNNILCFSIFFYKFYYHYWKIIKFFINFYLFAYSFVIIFDNFDFFHIYEFINSNTLDFSFLFISIVLNVLNLIFLIDHHLINKKLFFIINLIILMDFSFLFILDFCKMYYFFGLFFKKVIQNCLIYNLKYYDFFNFNFKGNTFVKFINRT